MTFSYKAIIFDCDGVIVDTENMSNQLLANMLGELGLQLDEKAMHKHFTGFTSSQTRKNAETLLGKALPDDFDNRFRKQFKHLIETNLEPIEGVIPLLSKLSCPIAMATNARRMEMELKLKTINLQEVFSTRFCAEDVEHGKPAPDLYLIAAEQLGIDPKDCLVIEDSVTGIKAGRSAGMRVLAYSSDISAEKQTEAGATACFSTMAELETLLGL